MPPFTKLGFQHDSSHNNNNNNNNGLFASHPHLRGKWDRERGDNLSLTIITDRLDLPLITVTEHLSSKTAFSLSSPKQSTFE